MLFSFTYLIIKLIFNKNTINEFIFLKKNKINILNFRENNNESLNFFDVFYFILFSGYNPILNLLLFYIFLNLSFFFSLIYIILFSKNNIINFFNLIIIIIFGGELKKPVLSFKEITVNFNIWNNLKVIDKITKINSYFMFYAIINIKKKNNIKNITNNLTSLFFFSKPLWIINIILIIIDKLPFYIEILKEKAIIVWPYIFINCIIDTINNHNINNIMRYFMALNNMRIYFDGLLKINGWDKLFSMPQKEFFLKKISIIKIKNTDHLCFNNLNDNSGIIFSSRKIIKINDNIKIENNIFGEKLNKKDFMQYYNLSLIEKNTINFEKNITDLLHKFKLNSPQDLIGFMIKTNLMFYFDNQKNLTYFYKNENNNTIQKKILNDDFDLNQIKLNLILNKNINFNYNNIENFISKNKINLFSENVEKINTLLNNQNKFEILKEIKLNTPIDIFNKIKSNDKFGVDDLLKNAEEILKEKNNII